MELSAENIEKALQQFYQDAASQSHIHSWLTQAQVSPQAWTFCWELLAKDKRPEVQFFGANCLHVKISKYWHELPAGQTGTLRSQLFEQIASYSTGPHMVLTRLCVALASFAMHTIPEVWPDAVTGIIATFQQKNLQHLSSTQVCQVLMEILTVIPEEMRNSQKVRTLCICDILIQFLTCYLHPHRRGIVRCELEKNRTQVLALLQELLSLSSPAPVLESALKCFSSWVQFGLPLNDAENLVLRVFETLNTHALFDTAIDTLIKALSHHENHRYPNTLQKLLPNLLQLESTLQRATEDHDWDTCQGLTKLIVTTADSCTKLLVNLTLSSEPQKQLALGVVKMVLMCSAMPGHFPVDEACSDMTFGFWYNLQDEIQESESGKYQALVSIYSPVFMSLVDVLLQKMQFPVDIEYDMWSEDEKEQYRCYRQDGADTLMYAYNLLHNNLLSSLCRLLATILEKTAAEQVRWQELESVLFSIASIAECVDLEENTNLPSLFKMLSQVPCSHQRLVAQALYIIGSYAEWISNHPETLSGVIPLMLQGLRDPMLAQAATLSLKEVIRENQDHIGPFVTQILSVTKDVLDENILKPPDLLRLMGCLGYVLSVLQVADIMSYLNVVLLPHIQQLQNMATVEPSAGIKTGILQKLNMLRWLFRSLNIDWRQKESDNGNAQPRQRLQEPQPIVMVLPQVLPIIQSVLTRWVTDTSIVEAVCDVVKCSLQTLTDNIREYPQLAVDITELVVSMYQACPQPAILEMATQVLIMFSAENSFRNNATVLFLALCSRSLTMFQTGVRDHPDVVEKFMLLLAQMVKKFPAVYSNESCNVVGLFQAALVAMTMPENPTAKAACSFMSNIIGSGDRVPSMKGVITSHGPLLVDRVIRAIAGESPRSAMDHMADVLHALNKSYYDLQCKWLTDVVNREGYPSPQVSRQEKEQFARKILKERVHKGRIKETVVEYSLIWRGLVGTEYAAQTAGHIS